MNSAGNLVRKARDRTSPLATRQEAFEALVLAFQDMAFACAYSVMGDFSLAEDAAQDAFISAWQKLDQLHEPDAFPGWFRRIVHTQCSRMRRGKRFQMTTLDDGINVASHVDDPHTAAEKGELKKKVFAAVGKLPRNERTAITLFYLEERSYSDIGAFLEIPMTTVAKRLHSARTHLKGKLMSDFKNRLTARRPSRDATFAEKVRAGIYDEYVGRYRFELRPELVVTIRREGDRLIGESGGQRNDLFAQSGAGDELMTMEFDGRGEFIRNRRGKISHLVYFEFGEELGRAKKIG